jgi:transposase
MGKPYSLDLRKRVVSAIEGGMSRNQAAKQFGVAISTAIGWMQRVEDTGSVAPGLMGGHKPKAFRETTRSGCRNGSRTAISPYGGSLPSLPDAA